MYELNSLQKNFTVELLRDKCNIESKSRIYGFILYTSSHPFVVKTLQDPAFWNALDEMSGPIDKYSPLNLKVKSFLADKDPMEL